MCGIAGFLLTCPNWRADALLEVARAMEVRLHHRGPDSGDVWADSSAGIAFAHRRLSIIDLSPAGAQPMTSACGRYVICYNGEIYNAGDVRPDLASKGIAFRGHSDTEVLLEACARWGVGRAVERMVGMFAFALWDKRDRRLTLVRDRMGIKPLYWGRSNGALLFTSELKALFSVPGFAPEIDQRALAGYLRHGYVPAPLTIYRDVSKLAPGTMLTLSPGAEPEITSYWSLSDVVANARTGATIDTVDAAADELEPLLLDAVKGRMLSDVPLGAFLSGGIDSSLVVALMQEQSTRPVRTYSIGFGEQAYNEAEHAKAVAAHLGTEHTEHYVDERTLLDIIPSLADIYDEPFADSSQIPTLILSALTRRDVTVALSGDGGDELFAGYNRYAWSARIDTIRRYLPGPVRHGAARMLRAPASAWDKLVQPMLQKRNRPGISVARRIHKLTQMLTADDGDSAYRALITFWHSVYPEAWEAPPAAFAELEKTNLAASEERMQFLDMLTYLPDDILTKVDRASMAHALEVRVPLLDHRVVEASWRAGLAAKLSKTGNKLVLRNLLYRRVPRELLERPKMGFAVPLERWLRQDLHEWARDLIVTTDWDGEFGIDGHAIRTTWDQHVSGRANWADHLWIVLMLAAWKARWPEPAQATTHDICSPDLVAT